MRKTVLASACSLLFFSNIALGLTLKEAILSAEKIDPQVQSSIANSDAARAGIQIARSKLLPIVQGTGSYGRTNQTANNVDPNAGLYTTKFINSTPNSQVYLRQSLFNAANWVGLSASELQNEFGLMRLASVYGDLWFRVSAAWFDLIAAQETFDIQTSAEQSMQVVAKQAQRAFEAGLGTKDSALEANAQLAFTRSNAVEAKLILASRQKSFEILTGIEYQHLVKMRLNFTKNYNVLSGNAKQFIDKAKTVAPEILAAKIAEEVRRMQLKQARFGSFPTVDLYGSYQQTQNYNINQIGLGVISSQAAVQITIPFYSGGLFQGQERQAAAYLESASAEIKAAELKLFTTIQTYWATQEAQIDRARAVQEMVRSSEEVVKAHRLGVAAGVKSWSDVANAEVILTRRKVDQVNALNALLKAQAQLLANLPVTDEAWHSWMSLLSFEVKKGS